MGGGELFMYLIIMINNIVKILWSVDELVWGNLIAHVNVEGWYTQIFLKDHI